VTGAVPLPAPPLRRSGECRAEVPENCTGAESSPNQTKVKDQLSLDGTRAVYQVFADNRQKLDDKEEEKKIALQHQKMELRTERKIQDLDRA